MLKIVAAAFLTLETVGPWLVGDNTGIVTSATLTRTTFLSTEDAQATLSVLNGTASQVVLDLGGTKLRVYSEGTWQEWPYCRRDCWRAEPQISPGTQRSFPIKLPSCEALSDPCAEDVILEYPVKASGQTHNYTVHFPQYRFVPDPNATYHDVKDGVPVYLTQGWARTTVVPSLGDVSILTPPSTSFSAGSAPTIFAEVAKIFRDAGLSVTDMRTEPDNPQWYMPLTSGVGAMRAPRPELYPANSWRMLYKLKAGMQQLPVLHETLAQIRRRFGNEVGKTYECATVAVDGPESDAMWSSADDDANRQADLLAQITKGGDLAWGYRIASRLSQPSSREPLCDPEDVTVYPALTALAPFNADVQVQMRHQGSQSPSSEISPGVVALARTAFAAPRPSSTYMPVLSIAADRPELYVMGGASGNASVNAGLVPNAVAILAARAQAKTIATILSLKLGTESLYATYAPGLWGDSTIGVATTFSRNGVAGSFRGADAAESLQLHGVQNSNSIDQNFIPNVPIDIAQSETAIRERTYAQAYLPYHMLRFQMELNSNNGPNAIATAPIVAKIRSVPGAVDAAASSANGGTSVLYNVVVQRTDRGAIPQIASIIAGPYAPAKAEVSFGLNPFIGDCAPAARELLRLTLQESWHAVQAATLKQHVRLRKLLLVAASPDDDGALCYPLSRDPGGREYESLDEMPLVPMPPVMESGVRLIFRTSR
jgi:hypothetical protein